jgi:hypothetical protein
MFILNEKLQATLKRSQKVEVCKKLVSDKKIVELVTVNPTEYAVTWDDIVVAILADKELAGVVFQHYCLQSMTLYPETSFQIIDFER